MIGHTLIGAHSIERGGFLASLGANRIVLIYLADSLQATVAKIMRFIKRELNSAC